MRILTLNRPEKLNAADFAMQQRLNERWREIASDDDVGAVVLAGAGRAFCAGGDLSLLLDIAPDDPIRVELAAIHRDLLHLMLSLPVPIVAAVHGAALGFGAELVALCDMAVLSRRRLSRRSSCPLRSRGVTGVEAGVAGADVAGHRQGTSAHRTAGRRRRSASDWPGQPGRRARSRAGDRAFTRRRARRFAAARCDRYPCGPERGAARRGGTSRCHRCLVGLVHLKRGTAHGAKNYPRWNTVR